MIQMFKCLFRNNILEHKQKMDLNLPEYVEFYGDSFPSQSYFYIAKKSIFINVIEKDKKTYFKINSIIKKRDAR